MKTITFNPLLLTIVLVIFIGILFKAPVKPPVPLIPPVGQPKPKIPVIAPMPVIIPVGGFGGQRNNDYINETSRLQCYSCEGSDNDPCAVSPATSSGKVTCAEEYMFCIVIRREISIEVVTVSDVTTPSTTNQTNLVSIDSQNSTTIEASISSTNVDTMTTDTAVANLTIDLDDGWNSTSLSPSTRTTTVRVVIQRGCMSLGTFLHSTIGIRKNSNESEYVNMCSKDLCNSGDGRLRCYECTGTGHNDSCMVNPSTVAQQVEIKVSRGCRARHSGFRRPFPKNDGTLFDSCYFSDFCNSFDTNRLVRPKVFSSVFSSHAKCSSLVIIFLFTHLLFRN
ncbi:hypothetical protein GHT06_015091 [Daphnia sinensis]|uniref:UPAR/Ly6 domain-containing protein n=1 Tax=Daphnia sinensis TaxID=1820382 RepID=A0AAD5L9T4_9CRUS|nr:hypothetical protein GHT06_015091 [Daphnia sinensis]